MFKIKKIVSHLPEEKFHRCFFIPEILGLDLGTFYFIFYSCILLTIATSGFLILGLDGIIASIVFYLFWNFILHVVINNQIAIYYSLDDDPSFIFFMFIFLKVYLIFKGNKGVILLKNINKFDPSISYKIITYIFLDGNIHINVTHNYTINRKIEYAFWVREHEQMMDFFKCYKNKKMGFIK